ncbi:TadE/TadG family type IV pilus assembly protein [Oceanimonas marisflavi]|uniref:TadE/TadG family type IV pilus assembly protein n=1 Tax=Oceanimonas marisflavi TaxID=2059724 RepID=UPI000D31C845|nr:TadE family protein [Oceanimonas marisflavi]
MNNLSRQKGLAAVEATIVMPVLLLMIMAVGEFGRALYQYNTLTKSVRAGAGFFAEHPGPVNIDKTKRVVVYGKDDASGDSVLPGLDVSDVTVGSSVVNGDIYIVVSAVYNWTPVWGDTFNTFVAGSLSLDFPLVTSVTMRSLE